MGLLCWDLITKVHIYNNNFEPIKDCNDISQLIVKNTSKSIVDLPQNIGKMNCVKDLTIIGSIMVSTKTEMPKFLTRLDLCEMENVKRFDFQTLTTLLYLKQLLLPYNQIMRIRFFTPMPYLPSLYLITLVKNDILNTKTILRKDILWFIDQYYKIDEIDNHMNFVKIHVS